MQRDGVSHKDFLAGIDEGEGAVDLSGLTQTAKRRERPSRDLLESVAEETGFIAGAARPRAEKATAQFAVRIYPSKLAEIEELIADRGWSKRVFLERAFKALVESGK